MREFEKRLLSQGYCSIVGIDEAGRGPLAGPVVAAAVNIPLDVNLQNIKDSKQLTPKKRSMICEEILQCGTVGIGMASPAEIDELNILQATFKAMKRALSKLQNSISLDFCIVDGNRTIPDLEIDQAAVVKGDVSCYLVAAASIAAKVYRDNLMIEYDLVYPEYGFAQHKGYPTKMHYRALAKYGPSPVHRITFSGVKEGYIS